MDPTTALSCNYCQKKLSCTSSLYRHLREIHQDVFNSGKKQCRIVCCLCQAETKFNSYELLYTHLQDEHKIYLKKEDKVFKDQKDFQEWKEKQEKENKTFFRKHGTSESTLGSVSYYVCHRSDVRQFKSKCQSRTPKQGGSIKINGICPARIRATFSNQSNEVFVNYVSNHLGHDLELKCQPLTEQEQKTLVEKIRIGVPFRKILKEARSIEGNEVSRLNLLNTKDLRYLAKKNKMDGKRDSSDLVSVDLKVAEWNATQKHVFIFKKPGEEMESLENKDFILGFMNDDMKYMLTTYGHNVICMDGTHGTNPYGFELTTILVLDDKNMGYPGAILLTNRKDKQIQELFLNEIKKIIGPIIPKYFMSDDTVVYWDSWNKIMGQVSNRLLCTWHVKKNWIQQSRHKINNKDILKSVQNNLDQILKATEEPEFLRLKEEFITFLNENNEAKFLEYFEKYYLQSNDRIQSWAHCYRVYAGINTNMHLEAMHKNLKYNYFNGKSVQRLESCLDAIDQLVTDKSWQRVALLLPLIIYTSGYLVA